MLPALRDHAGNFAIHEKMKRRLIICAAAALGSGTSPAALVAQHEVGGGLAGEPVGALQRSRSGAGQKERSRIPTVFRADPAVTGESEGST